MPNTSNKILVFRFSAMGDVAMTVPVLQALIQQNPELEIVMVSRPFFKPLFNSIPQVSFVGVDLKKDYKGIGGLFKLFKELKKQKPDAIADLHDVLRTKILRVFFKVSGYKIATINKGRGEKKALTRTKNKVLKPLQSTHERYADVFRKLGLNVDLQQFKAIKPNLLSETKLFLQTFDNNLLLGIAPFAAHKGKQYPLEKVKEVINKILEQNTTVNILLFGGGKKEKELLDTLEEINRNRVFNLAGMFSFEQELAIISHLSVMLSMDSGNGHLAALFGVPVVTVWGATHPFAGFAPFNQTEQQQILPDLQKFPQLPTSIYGNKTFEGFEKIWDYVPSKKICDIILLNLIH